MTTIETVRSWLNAALHQLAAESYLQNVNLNANTAEVIRRLKYGFNDPEHTYIYNPDDPEKGKAGHDDSNAPTLPGPNRMVQRFGLPPL